MSKLHNEQNDQLFKAILGLESIEDCYNFFLDLCTIKELQDMAQRLETAIMLDNKANYETITKEIGASAATISRVSRCLNYGEGGYKKAIDKLKRAKE